MVWVPAGLRNQNSFGLLSFTHTPIFGLPGSRWSRDCQDGDNQSHYNDSSETYGLMPLKQIQIFFYTTSDKHREWFLFDGVCLESAMFLQ